MVRRVEITNSWVSFEQFGHALFQNRFSVILIEFREDPKRRKRDTLVSVHLANQFGCVLLPHTRTGTCPFKNNAAHRQVFPKKSCLVLPERGQLVIVGLEEGSLRVANEEKLSHWHPIRS